MITVVTYINLFILHLELFPFSNWTFFPILKCFFLPLSNWNFFQFLNELLFTFSNYTSNS